MKKLLFVIYLTLAVAPYASAQVLSFPFEESSGVTTTTETITNEVFNIQNNYNRPERIEGISGNALRLDGWSTWLSKSGFTIPSITNQITIETWYSTEAFSAANQNEGGRPAIENAAIISQIDANSGIALKVGSYGNVGLDFFANGQKYQIKTSNNIIQKYQWHHIAGVIDLVNQTATIYLDGEIARTDPIGAHTSIDLSSTTFYIGRHNESYSIDGVEIIVLNGSLDELNIYNTALDQSDIQDIYNLGLPLEEPNLFIDPDVRHQGDQLRPRYHPMPNTNWTNESYGLTYYNGKYHMYYQKNPNGPILHFMHWGHLSSPDLVNWTEEDVTLAPDDNSWETFGNWSGTTVFDENNEPVIVYTGVNTGEAGMGLAYPLDDDLITWEKYAGNPVLDDPPGGFSDFRDPYVWKDNGMYYMIIGSARGGFGALPTYKSSDLVNWSQISTLFTSRDGRYFEMPSFLKLNENNEYMLTIGPLPNPGDTRAQAFYYIGKWENELFEPYSNTATSIDFSLGRLLAPAVGYDEENRPMYMGIIPDTRSGQAQIQGGWRNIFSLPRVIRLLEDSLIGQHPHPYLCRLRTDEIKIENRTVTPGDTQNLSEFSGNQTEFLFKLKAEDSTLTRIRFFQSSSGAQYTEIRLDLERDRIVIDGTNGSSESAEPATRVQDYIFDSEDSIYVNIFLDHSVFEIFIDNMIVYSGRVYPSETSQLIDITVDQGSVVIGEAYQWTMVDTGDAVSNEVCEPEFLPTAFRKKKEDEDDTVITSIEEPYDIDLFIYPNPAGNYLVVQSGEFLKSMPKFTIIDSTGKRIRLTDPMPADSEGRVLLNLSTIHSGIYLLNIQTAKGRILKKIIKK